MSEISRFLDCFTDRNEKSRVIDSILEELKDTSTGHRDYYKVWGYGARVLKQEPMCFWDDTRVNCLPSGEGR